MPGLPKLIPSPRETTAAQVTSLSVDSWGRLVCNTLDEAWEGAHGDFDVIVIGSGMYGGFAAEKLFQLSGPTKPKVLLLDMGRGTLPEHIDNLPHSSELAFELGGVRGFPYLDSRPLSDREQYSRNERHHYCVGGKSIAWGKWAPRLTDDDLARWPAAVAEYLKSNSDLEGYNVLELETGVVEETAFVRGPLQDALLAKANEVSADFSQLVSPKVFPKRQPPVACQGSSPASGLFSFDAFNSLTLLVDAVRRDVERAGDNDEQRSLFVVPQCRVYRLDHRGGRIVGLHVLHRDPMLPRYLPIAHKTRVVMACNSMESTRLALLSNLPEPAGGPLMGRNLMVHLRSNFSMRIPRAAFGDDLPEKLQPAALHVQGNAGERRFHFQIFAAADPGFDANRLIYKLLPDFENRQAMLDSQQSGYITLRVLTCGELLGHPESPVGTPGTCSARIATSADDPQFQDVIGGVPIPKLFADWSPSAADIALWGAMDTMAFNFVQRMGVGHLVEIRHPDNIWRDSAPNFADYRDTLSSTFHEAGTLWMGDDSATSVTGPNGRLHRVSNLYCVDQAVFPTCGSANPVLTGLAVTRMVVLGILNELGLRRGFREADGDDLDRSPEDLAMIPPWNL